MFGKKKLGKIDPVKKKTAAQQELDDLMPDEDMNPEKLDPLRKKSLYEILGLKPDASPEEIKAAYRKAARDTHPDLHQDDPEAQEKFQLVQRAGAVLTDPSRRKMYDVSDEMEDASNSAQAPWKQKLISLFFEVERQLLVDGVSYKHKNLFGIMATMIDNGTKQEKANIEEIKKFIKLQEEIAARISVKGESNLFATMVDGEVRRMQRDIEACEANIADNQKMKEELKVYKYAHEEPPQPKPDPRTARRPDGAVYLGRIDMGGGAGGHW